MDGFGKPSYKTICDDSCKKLARERLHTSYPRWRVGLVWNAPSPNVSDGAQSGLMLRASVLANCLGMGAHRPPATWMS